MQEENSLKELLGRLREAKEKSIVKVEEELENSSPEEQIAILSEELPENVLEEYDDSPQKQKIELRRIDDDSQPPLPPPH